MTRYAPPAAAGLAGALLVLALLALCGWPGPLAWQVTHVAIGGGIAGTWTWTQAQGTTPVPLVVGWWPPLLGAVLVLGPILAASGGWLAAIGAGLAAATATASIWVARDCVDRLGGQLAPRAPTLCEPSEQIDRLERVHREATREIDLLTASAPESVARYVRRHRSDEGRPPRLGDMAHG